MRELTGLGPRTAVTPQLEQAEPLQVKNHAGGYVFELDPFDALTRFLVLGTAGGTYYASERDHTKAALDTLRQTLALDGARFVDVVVEVSEAGRAPKNDQALFALALAAAEGDAATKARALDALTRVARTGSHLFAFAEFVQSFRGWGRGLRRAVARWYETMDADRLALQLVKYRQRNGWTHRDLLRLAHPRIPRDEQSWEVSRRRLLLDFACGKDVATGADVVEGFVAAQREGSDLADLAVRYRLPWEALPNERIDANVLGALVDHDLFPLGALVRQLPRLTREGVLDDHARQTRLIERLRDAEAIKRARLHPFALLLAQTTYAAGRSVRGSGTWTPKAALVDALNDAFYLAFANVEPTGKRRLVALDVSGSMAWPTSRIHDSHLHAREAAAAMALVTLAADPLTDVIAFADGGAGSYRGRGQRLGGYPWAVTPLALSARQRLDDVVKATSHLPAGGTDCALPMLYARDAGKAYDSFEVMTDNETWHGQVHPYQALRDYRAATGIDARLVVVGMTATNFTIADPRDKGMLDVVGFDAAAPALIADFVAGRL